MNNTASHYRNSFTEALSGYVKWWLFEVNSLIPQTIRSMLFSNQQLVFELGLDEISIVHVIGNKKNIIYQALASILIDDELLDILSHKSAIHKVLNLSKNLVLEKNVKLPLVTEENLHEVLSFEMDRFTPFSSNQVYYDFQIKSRDKKNNNLFIKLIVAPKAKIDPWLTRLKQYGFEPHAVSVMNEVTNDPLPINLLPISHRAKKPNTLRKVNLALTTLVVLLLVSALLLPIWSKLQRIDQLKPILEGYGQESIKINELRNKIELATSEKLFLTDKKSNEKMMLEVINELSFVVPDDTWINHMEVKNNEVHIHGQSAASAVLLPLIEASEVFRNAQFRSPVTQNRKTNTERFHLSVEIAQALPQ